MSFLIDKHSVLAALSQHIGKERGITASDLVSQITWSVATPGECRHLRHVIEELRNEGQHICAHPSLGYFIAANEKELNQTCEFLFHRAMTSLTQVAKMKKVSLPDLRGQLGLKL